MVVVSIKQRKNTLYENPYPEIIADVASGICLSENSLFSVVPLSKGRISAEKRLFSLYFYGTLNGITSNTVIFSLTFSKGSNKKVFLSDSATKRGGEVLVTNKKNFFEARKNVANTLE